jgi:starch synthase
VRSRVEPPIGILNGIDYDTWDPSADALLYANYTTQDFAGKRANKEGLFRDFGLDVSRIDRPLLAMISRIDVQKGFDLVVTVLDELLSQELSFILLGSGNKETEKKLAAVIAGHPGKAVFASGYDDSLAHRIEAGADIFLMPSKYEPCGLNQMYSMRYGTVPVVRATGGLADTVREFNAETGEGTGFRFIPYDSFHFNEAITRALRYWENSEQWRSIVTNGMQSDFSWARSAMRYAEVYENVRKRRQY